MGNVNCVRVSLAVSMLAIALVPGHYNQVTALLEEQ